jgi:hypothetical protein
MEVAFWKQFWQLIGTDEVQVVVSEFVGTDGVQAVLSELVGIGGVQVVVSEREALKLQAQRLLVKGRIVEAVVLRVSCSPPMLLLMF